MSDVQKMIAEIEDLKRDPSVHEQDIYICGYRDGSNEAVDDILEIIKKYRDVSDLNAL